MSIKKLQKKVEEEFDEIYSYPTIKKPFIVIERELKKFISEQLDKAYELGREEESKEIINNLPKKRNKPHTEPLEKYKGWDKGFNNCLEKILKTLSKRDNK